MTHDPDHDLRALHPDLSNGLTDRRAEEAYRAARSGGAEPDPWELRGVDRRPARRVGGLSGAFPTVRVVIVLLLAVALVVALVGRW